MKFAIVIGIALLSISCSKKTTPTVSTENSVKANTEEKPTMVEEAIIVDYEKENFIAAIVVDMTELDGCGYMLKLENGNKLQPTSALAKEFKVSDMPVWIKYTIKKGAAGTCMSGQIVTLTAIAKK